MASLLGGEYCIESLQRDVQDLQSIIDEVQSRVGQVKYQSWKFPDKASCDLSISKLLESCVYSEDDEEESQMSHVMLYDLVIDRLVYLLQTFICFNEILLRAEDGNFPLSSLSPVKKGSVRSMSIGLSVKKCWARITQIATLLQKLAKQASEQPPAIEDKKTEMKSPDPIKDTSKSPDSMHDKDVSCDVRTIGVQTAESAYATCETCAKAQQSLHEVGRTIIRLCKEQSLPTALEDYQGRYDDGSTMSVADLLRWAKHQSKDLSRISRHMTNIMKQVNPLKADLATAVKNEKDAKSELQMCQAVFDRKANEMRDEFQRKEYVLKENEKDLNKRVSTLETIKASMEEEIEKSNWKISDLKDELLQKHRDHLSVENLSNKYKEEVMEGRQYKQDATKFKAELSRVKLKLEELEQSVDHERKLYQRERSRNENMAQHKKMLQDKQRSLLRRMEALNDECDKLREHVLGLEEDRDTSISKLEAMEQSKSDHEKSFHEMQKAIDNGQSKASTLQDIVDALKKENENQQSMIDGYRERERLLVAYPDLNQENVKSPIVEGTGDVFTDMRNQIDANSTRIEILQKENEALGRALNTAEDSEKSPESYSQRSLSTARSTIPPWYQGDDPIQLWQTTDISALGDNDHDARFQTVKASKQYTRNSGLQSSSCRNTESPDKKPPSGRQNTFTRAPNHPHKRSDVPDVNGTRYSGTVAQSTTSLEAYKKLKAHTKGSSQNTQYSFTVGAGRRPTSNSRPSSAKSALFKPWT